MYIYRKLPLGAGEYRTCFRVESETFPEGLLKLNIPTLNGMSFVGETETLLTYDSSTLGPLHEADVNAHLHDAGVRARPA